MSRETVWHNEDGLAVGFGTRSAQTNTGGATVTAGRTQEIVYTYDDLTALGTDATADSGIYAAGKWVNSPQIPAGATVQKVTITTDTAATSGGAADLLIGIYTISDTDGLLDAVDADGLAAAGDSALADFSAVGETVVLDKSAAAAYIGKVNVGSSPVVVAPTYATAAYTAGALTVTVEYTK